MQEIEAVDALAVKERPKSLGDIVGNKKSIDIISGFLNRRQIVKTWLISGLTGSGKTSIARLIGTIINCENLKL